MKTAEKVIAYANSSLCEHLLQRSSDKMRTIQRSESVTAANRSFEASSIWPPLSDHQAPTCPMVCKNAQAPLLLTSSRETHAHYKPEKKSGNHWATLATCLNIAYGLRHVVVQFGPVRAKQKNQHDLVTPTHKHLSGSKGSDLSLCHSLSAKA